MITTASVLSKVQTILNDAGATRWPIAELLGWLNDGLRELIKIHPDAKVKRAPLTLSAGAKQILPDDAVLLMGVEGEDGTAVTPCVQSVLDAFNPGWKTRPAKGLTHFMYSPGEPAIFFIYPAQTESPASVVLVYSAYPAVATGGGSLDVQAKYANSLIDYVLFRAYSKDAEFAGAANLAAAYYQSFSK